MTSRERLLATLRGEAADRMPVAPFVYANAVRELAGNPDVDLIEGTLDYCEHFGFDCMLRNFNVRHDDMAVSTPDWRISRERIERDDVVTTRVRIDTPGGALTQTDQLTRLSPYQTVAATTEHLVKRPEDFEMLRRYQPPPAPPDLGELRRAKGAIGQRGILAPWVWGVFNYMSGLRKLDDLLMDPYEEPDFFAAFGEYCLNRLLSAVEPVLAEGLDMVSYTGNVAGGMVGPAFFDEHVLPLELPLVRRIQAAGCGVLYHNCGDGARMIPCYNKLMPTAYESMTEPPYADNTLTDCLREFDPEIALIGNLDQIDFLRNATPEAVEARAREVAAMGAARGRFILGTSDFIEERTPPENLFALARSVL